MQFYKTQGVCAQAIEFEVKDNKVYNVNFINGCAGNTKGIASLVDGMEVNEVIARLEGIQCRKNTSCPDQLAKALKGLKEQI